MPHVLPCFRQASLTASIASHTRVIGLPQHAKLARQVGGSDKQEIHLWQCGNGVGLAEMPSVASNADERFVAASVGQFSLCGA